jgi:hypothetical protein
LRSEGSACRNKGKDPFTNGIAMSEWASKCSWNFLEEK